MNDDILSVDMAQRGKANTAQIKPASCALPGNFTNGVRAIIFDANVAYRWTRATSDRIIMQNCIAVDSRLPLTPKNKGIKRVSF